MMRTCSAEITSVPTNPPLTRNAPRSFAIPFSALATGGTSSWQKLTTVGPISHSSGSDISTSFKASAISRFLTTWNLPPMGRIACLTLPISSTLSPR